MKIPVDDTFFKNVNEAQWLWYSAQLEIDQEEDFEKELAMTDYLASFINPEAVQEVKNARENSFSTSDEDFDDFIQSQFGRKVDGNKKTLNERDIKDKPNIKGYLDMDLDDIHFIPLGDK